MVVSVLSVLHVVVGRAVGDISQVVGSRSDRVLAFISILSLSAHRVVVTVSGHVLCVLVVRGNLVAAPVLMDVVTESLVSCVMGRHDLSVDRSHNLSDVGSHNLSDMGSHDFSVLGNSNFAEDGVRIMRISNVGRAGLMRLLAVDVVKTVDGLAVDSVSIVGNRSGSVDVVSSLGHVKADAVSGVLRGLVRRPVLLMLRCVVHSRVVRVTNRVRVRVFVIGLVVPVVVVRRSIMGLR